jgi:hypothetical protein
MYRRIFQCNVACRGGSKSSCLNVMAFLQSNDSVRYGTGAPGIIPRNILVLDFKIKVKYSSCDPCS